MKRRSKRSSKKGLMSLAAPVAGVGILGGLGYAAYNWLSNRSPSVPDGAPQMPPAAKDPTVTPHAQGNKVLSDLAPSLAQKVADDLKANGKAYSHSLLRSFQASVGILVDGLYGPQSARALQAYVPDAPPGLKAYGGSWDGISSQVSGVPQGSNVVDATKRLDQTFLAKKILTMPEGQDKRYHVACFQRGEKLPVTGQVTTDPETLPRLKKYAG